MNSNTNNKSELDNNMVINTLNCSFDNLNNIIYKQNSLNIFTMNICNLEKHFNGLCISIDKMDIG